MTGTKENLVNNNDPYSPSHGLPDLSGWHPVPDDATVPVGMQMAARRRYDEYTEVYSVTEWETNPQDRYPAAFDYFTPEPVQSPPPKPLPTEPGTWIAADLRNGRVDLVLRLNENGDWIGVTDNRSMVSVPASYIAEWCEIKWVPAYEPKSKTVQQVEPKIDDANLTAILEDLDEPEPDYPEELEKLRSQVRATGKVTPEPVRQVDLEPHDEPGNLCMKQSPGGWMCTRPTDHSDLHVHTDADRVRAIWGEVQ